MEQLLEAEWLSLLGTVHECIVFITSFLERSVGREGGFLWTGACPTDLQAFCTVCSRLVAFYMQRQTREEPWFRFRWIL